MVKVAPSKQTRQHNDVGASTLANGGTWTWVQVPITSTITTTQRVTVPSISTTLATTTQTNLVLIASSTMTSTTQMVSVTIASSTMTTTQTVVPNLSFSSNSFSFPLHNAFDRISPDELPHSSPVLDVVSQVAHDDMHSKEVERLHQMENPAVDDVTATLPDDQHYHSNSRELVETPKGSYAHVPHSSPVEHDDVHGIC